MKAENKGIDDVLYKYLVHSVESTPFYQLMGIEMVSVERGKAVMSVHAEEHHTNPLGFIHGGLIMSMADAAMGNAIRSLGIKAVTVDLSNSFPSAGRLGDDIRAEGKVIRAGKQLIYTEAEVFAGERLLGHAKATFFKIGEVEL